MTSTPENHDFIPPTDSDSRSPCPALNSLANRGYLPRSGKDITIFQFIDAIRSVYNLSLPFAFALAFGGLVTCGHGFFPPTVTLSDLAAHNRIEHDASLVHDDAPPHARFAPVPVDKELLNDVLKHASDGHGLTLNDFARARVDREDKLTKPLGAFHHRIACGEAALAWMLMQDKNGEVPIKRLEEWWGEETLPHDWNRPDRTIGLLEVRGKIQEVADAMKKLSDKGEHRD